MNRRHKPRRGVVLLVVLTLLTLLIVLGVTLVVVSGTFRRGAETAARQERYGDDPEQLMDRAMYQLVRDTPDSSRSRLYRHSLLRDLFGNDGVTGVVGEVKRFVETDEPVVPPSLRPSLRPSQAVLDEHGDASPIDGEFLEFEVSAPSFSLPDEYYNGCTLTFLDPVVRAGREIMAPSTRIVRYKKTQHGTIKILVEWSAFDEEGYRFEPKPGDRFVINGRPFNGTGAGYDHSHSLDQMHPTLGVETALLPNYSSYADTIDPSLGGLDEPWDAVDFQNMFLAMVSPDTSNRIIPSFHRPALVNYWIKRSGLGLDVFRDPTGAPAALQQYILQLKRSIILRPLPQDHRNFPNNEQFIRTMGQENLADMVWDVDNDGDGVPDSIWMDVGFPIQTDDSGRRYKPLVAILCQDLDGRLNVNAHSNVAQMEKRFASSGELQRLPSRPFARKWWGETYEKLPLPRGLGVGPAEIFLGHIFNWNDFAHVLSQRHRFNILDQNGNLKQNAARIAGEFNRDDPLSQIKSLGIPYDYSNEFSAYGSPPDLWGKGGIGLDFTGQPIPVFMGERGETKNDPYEMVLNRKSAGYHDAPFTVAELERVLRYDDVDAFGLPNRLVHNSILNAPVAALTGNSAEARRNRRLITTHSSHLPITSGILPKKMLNEILSLTEGIPEATNMFSRSGTILDLYRARIICERMKEEKEEHEEHGDNFDPEKRKEAFDRALQQMPTIMGQIVPWEIWHGERFNVNRLLNNIEAIRRTPPLPPEPYDTVPFNYLNDDRVISEERFAPQIYARHLYCLMMLLADHDPDIEYFHPTSEELTEDWQRRELTAQRIAQWAINVVDFRDADGIMTRFEYDIKPFNGWDNKRDEMRVVWGTEYPELLLTEAVAFHDVRWKDTEWDDSGKKTTDPDEPDNTTDQYRIPQGSLFLELYCTRNRFEKRVEDDNRFENHAMFPRELYNPVYDPSDPSKIIDYQLDLSRMAGDSPVWRIAISRSYDDEQSPDQRRETQPDTTSFQPQTFEQPNSMSLVSPAGGAPDVLDVERYVWFANRDPATTGLPPLEQQKRYYNRNDPGDPTNAQLPPASYLVVGPRAITYKGSQEQAGDSPEYAPSNNKIKLLGSRIETYLNDGTDDTITPDTRYVKPARTIVAAANAPIEVDDSGAVVPDSEDAWNLDLPIGLNVSEPIPLFGPDPDEQSYYDEPQYRLTGDFPLDSYYQHDPAPQQGKLPTKPFDTRDWSPLIQDGIVDEGEDENPEFEPRLKKDYKTAFLQRLANPTEPWDPAGNPYITVDWTPIDLTVFNGEDDNPESIDIDRFATRERGSADKADLNLWSVETSRHAGESPEAPADYFQLDLLESLGYLNEIYRTHAGGSLVAPAVVNESLGYYRAPTADYIGDPALPFPWLAWHNRPFANPMELMQVPSSTPSRLSHEFDIRPTTDPYPSDPYPADNVESFRGTFPHLLNFFHSSSTDDENRRGANFYRLFDYVETPSPFVGAEKWYNAETMIHPIDPDDADQFHFHPPYNHLSRFQDPGRVNINTIFDPRRVWEGIAKAFPAMDPTVSGGNESMFHRIFESRRGYGVPADGKFFALNSDYPTLFANPFRPADSADLMPDVPPGDNSMRKAKPVQATLLREDVLDRTQPLFVPDADAVDDLRQDQNRNSYFRYHGMARLSNLVTNNSNVFALWITLGYFEVEPNVPENAPDGTPPVIDEAHPDGFRLGPELGTYSGDIKRHRAFYIIDRSEPVAFEPGQNHNVDNCILLRRFIE